MKTRRTALVPLLALGLALPPTALPEASAQTPDSDLDIPVFGVESAVVLLDVVVRDKKGRLVKDLTAADFEVFENGERQTITDFQVFDRGPLHFTPGAGGMDAQGNMVASEQSGVNSTVCVTRPTSRGWGFSPAASDWGSCSSCPSSGACCARTTTSPWLP